MHATVFALTNFLLIFFIHLHSKQQTENKKKNKINIMHFKQKTHKTLKFSTLCNIYVCVTFKLCSILPVVLIIIIIIIIIMAIRSLHKI